MALKPFLTTLAASLLLCAAGAVLAEDLAPTDPPLPGDVQVSQPAASRHKARKVQGSNNLVTADTSAKPSVARKKSTTRKLAKPLAKRHGVKPGKLSAKGKSVKAPVVRKGKSAKTPVVGKGKSAKAPVVGKGKSAKAPVVGKGKSAKATVVRKGKTPNGKGIAQHPRRSLPAVNKTVKAAKKVVRKKK